MITKVLVPHDERLGISVWQDSLSWNESSSQRSQGCCSCQSADAAQGTRQVIPCESDILPCGTPKRHKRALKQAQQHQVDGFKCCRCVSFRVEGHYTSSHRHL